MQAEQHMTTRGSTPFFKLRGQVPRAGSWTLGRCRQGGGPRDQPLRLQQLSDWMLVLGVGPGTGPNFEGFGDEIDLRASTSFFCNRFQRGGIPGCLSRSYPRGNRWARGTVAAKEQVV